MALQSDSPSTLDRFPKGLQAEHDQFMASNHVMYRGFTIRPQSHLHQPFFQRGHFIYWGFVVTDAKGTNVAPGATWSPTLGGAKTIVDCLHDAGPEPQLVGHLVPLTTEEIAEHRRISDEHHAWAQRFWEMIRERHERD